MPSAKRSITINRPMREVFDFVADGMNGPQWRPGGIEVKHESGTGKGAIYRQSVPGPMGRRIAADYAVTSWDPPKRMAFKAIAGPVRPTGEYVLAAAGENATKLTFSLDAQMGLVRRLLMGRAVQRSMDSEMRSLDKLKKVLEGGKSAPAATAATSGSDKPAAGRAASKTTAKATAKPAAKVPPKPVGRASSTTSAGTAPATKPAGSAPATKAAAKPPAKPGPKPTSRRSPRRPTKGSGA